MSKKFEFLSHTADIKFKLYGKSLNEIFESSVLAFSSYISRNKKLKNNSKKSIIIKSSDLESLLYKFLDELIYLLDADNFAAVKAKVKVDKKNNSLKAELFGNNKENYSLNHVKAATYAEMYIKEITKGKKESWEAQVVLDV